MKSSAQNGIKRQSLIAWFKSTLLLLFLTTSGILSAQLNGTYTIGGTSPNYSSVSAAVSALNTSGVSGNVIFNIRQGTYTEKIAINSITGVSASKTVTFRPDPANSSAVTIQYTNSSSSLNYIVRLNGAQHVTFTNLKFKAAGTSYSTVFELAGLNDFITIDSCTLEMNSTLTGGTTYRAGIYELSGSANRTSNFTLSNSTISGGSYGIYAYGYSSGTWFQKDWKIQKNIIEDFYYMGLYLYYYFDTVQVEGNQLTQRSNATGTSYGMSTYLCYNTNVESNKVIMTSNSSYGMYLAYNYGQSSRRQRVANNMISMVSPTTSGTRYGLYTYYCNYTDVAFNSLYQAAGLGYLLYGRLGTGNSYKNNAISNLSSSTSGYAMYYQGTSTQSHNCVWNPFGYTSNLSLGTGSKNKNPLFVSSTNLHTSSIDLNNAGTPVSGITKDFDGQTRSTTVPDIGADEFTPPSNDAGIDEISNSTVCAGSNSIKVRIRNYGSNTLSSATINWTMKVNSGSPVLQTAYSFTGSLASGKDTIVSIGNYSMTSTNSYAISAWSSSPNSSTDGNSANDSASQTYTTSLSGIYTVGGLSPDYTTIQAAATAVKNKGVCGAVTFHIRPGSYNEAVFIDSGKGLSSTNTVTFMKDPTKTGEVLWYRNGRPVTFRNTKHIVLKNLIIETRSASNAIYFQNDNSDITIKKNILRGYNTNSSAVSYAIVYGPNSSGFQTHRLSIDSNQFRKGAAMVYLSGVSTTVSLREFGNKIRYNTYDSAGYYGIYLQNQDSVEIIGNSITDMHNSGTQYGILLNAVNNYDLEKNKFILNRRTNSWGIYLSGGGGTSGGHSKVINNYCELTNGQYGIYSTSSAYTDYYYNTVRLYGTNTGSYAAYFNYGNAYLKNNNFSNEADGYVIFTRLGTYFPLSDNNNFYTTSTMLFAYANGYRTSFALWKSATSKDANSVSVKPYWKSIKNPEPNNSSLNGTGSTISGVTTDINGASRSSTPDIGCIEFTPSTNDAGVDSVLEISVCPGSSPVKIKLRNFGNNTLTQARIQWNVKTNSGSPISQTAYTWTGSLQSYSDTVISIGNYTFVGSNTYAITAYTDQANSTTDLIKSNDSASINSVSPKMTGVYTVGGTSPNYTNLNSALLALQSKGVCGPVTLNIRGGAYNGRSNFYDVPGASATNTITVQRDPSSTTHVDLYYNGYPFYFSGASHFIIKNLKIRTTGSSSVVYFGGSNNNITFENDSLIGSLINTTSSGYSVFYDNTSTAAIQQDLIIKQCVIENGSYGLYLYGNSSTGIYAQTGIEISDCKLLNQYYTGVYGYYCPEITIKNNIIQDRNTYTSAYGTYLQYCDSSEISGNNISIGKGYCGIYSTYSYGNSSKPGASIYNNFIQFTDTSNTSTKYGIYQYGNTYSIIAFNSVNVPSGSNSSSCLYSRYGSNQKIVNNNFVNSSSGYAQYLLTSSAVVQLDYNNNYVTGINLGYYNGNRTSLALWKTGTGTGKATNSISVDPLYVSHLDLHAQSTAIDGKGTPIVGITKDIDGDTRSTSTPDIGADEFAIFARDAGITSINSSSVCLGSNPVKVTLRNYGTSSLTSTTIQWRISTNAGAAISQTAFSFSGNLASGKDTVLSIGSYSFTKGNSYVITANVDGFNSTTDQNTANDTASSISLTPKMSGLYTVGSAAGTDWKTIDSAITALETVGVCGPVIIYVKSGSYLESVVFDAIPGVTSINNVTIFGDTTGVGADWYSSGIPLTLNNVNYTTFKNLKIRTTGYTNAIRFYSNNSYLTFDDNHLEGRNYNATSTAYAVVYNDNSSLRQQNNITFKNNTIENGSMSFYWFGYSTGVNAEIGNSFINNELKTPYYMGFYVQRQDSVLFEGNKINTKSGYTNCYGFYGNQIYNYKILKNTINVRTGGTGLYLGSSSGSNLDSSEVVNNFITLGGTNTSYGIQTTSSNYVKYLHNSIHLFNTNTNSYCFYHNNGLGVEVKNNTFYNSGNGRVIRVSNLNYYIGDYNNLKTNGSIFGYYAGNRTTIALWRTATSDDANSVSVNPNYTDTFDLHTTSATLNNAGTPLGVLVDIDGNTRSITTPDIGADEFNSVPRDLGLLSIEKGACEGTQNVELKIKNDGTSTITKARIKWTVSTNGGTPVAQTDFVLIANLVSLKDTIISLGNVTFARGSYYDILAYVDSVNNGLDQNTTNDTIVVDSNYAAMTGIYTVGGTSPDFTTITASTDALKARGVCGKVFLNIRPGTYVERIYFPTAIAGADTGNTITFQTDTGTTSQAYIRNSNVPVQLLGASHVRVNNLKIATTGSVNVVYSSGASDIQVTNCNLEGFVTNSSSVGYSVIRFYKSTSGDDNLLVESNTIQNGSAGIAADGNGWNSKLEIRANVISNFNTYGIYTYRADSISVTGNTFTNKRTSSSFISAIYQGYSVWFKIIDNKIDLNGSYVGNANRTGISLVGCDGLSSKRAEIYNNFIAIGGFSTNVNGMELVQSDYINIDHNSVNIYSSGSTSKAVYLQTSTNNYLRNNSFVNNGGGFAFYTNNQPTSSNFNNLYTSGSVLGYYSGNRNTIAQWRSATSRDQQSVSVKPNYFSSTNLHTSSVGLDGKGTNLTYITTDIDGDTRGSIRDIGADEFSPIARDASIIAQVNTLCPGSNSIKIEMTNVGSQTISSAKIKWEISTNNGAYISQTKASYSGSLTSGSKTIVTLGNFTFLNGNVYSIRAVVDTINNLLDGNSINDTAFQNNVRPALSGTYSVGTGGDFTTIAAADSVLDQSGVCGPVILELNQGTYNEGVTMGNYSGVSAINTITLRPDSSNTAPVYWTFAGVPLAMDNASFITVLGLNITTTGNANVVYLVNDIHDITFKDNTFTGSNYSVNSSAYANVQYLGSSVNRIRNVSFEGNVFSKGTSGFYATNSSSYKASSLTFRNNTFSNYRYDGITMSYADSLVIEGNNFTNTLAYSATGIYLTYSNHFSIQKNKIDHSKLITSRAIFIGYCNATSSSGNDIVNNFFAINARSAERAVQLIGSTYINFIYNSIRVNGLAASSMALYAASGSFNSYFNNNIVNSADGYVIYVTGTNEYASANNNNLYTSSTSKLGYFKGSYYTNLSAWRTASSRDGASVSGDPFYKGTGDLHALGLATNNSGAAFAAYTTDIDGETRGTNPDIGADEYTASPDDAGLDSLSKSLFCLGSNNVYVKLTNYGTDTLKSATINWRVVSTPGNTQNKTAYSWTGSLLTGQSTLVNIGSFNLGVDTSYQVFANSTLPNGKSDGYVGNDSTQNGGGEAAMSGTYIVAQSGTRDYSSLNAAASDLNLRGVCGPVNIKVKDGTYSGTVLLQSIDGTSAINRVVIESDTSNTNRAILSASNYTVSIQGVDYLTIRGFDIKSTRYAGVYITNANNHVTVENNKIENSYSLNYYNYYYYASVSVYNTTNKPNTNISILNNTIHGGQYGIYSYSAQKADKGIIEGNHISDFRNKGIYVQNDFDLTIKDNAVFDSTFAYGNYGIHTMQCAVDLIGNKVAVNGQSGGYGVYIQNSKDTTGARKSIVNNAITFNQKQIGYTNNWGLYLYFCDYQNVYYNSVLVDGGTNTNSRAFMVHSGLDASLRNNSFVNNNQGYAVFESTNSQITSSDYNNFYSNGSRVAYRSGTNYNALSNWRSGTGFDANSTSAYANYMSAYNMTPNHIALDGTGTILSAVQIDIDGVVRGSSPDIGAYQFVTRKDDAGSVTLVSKQLCNGTQNVIFAVKNFGGDTLKSARVYWQVSRNGGAYVTQPVYNWVGVMRPGDVDSNVSVGSYNFIGGAYKVRSYTSLPNNKTDELQTNDTLVDDLYIKLNGTYTLGDTSSDFKTWNAFSNAINKAGVCGPVIIKAKPGTYYENINLNNVEGLSSTDNLVITSDTGKGLAILSDSITPLSLVDMNYVTIRGIGLKSTGTESALRLEGNNRKINIDSNSIVGPVSYGSSATESSVYINSTGTTSNSTVRDIRFEGNEIENGSSAIHIQAASTTWRVDNILIKANEISNFYSNGVYAYGVDSLTISENTVSSSAGSSPIGINMYYSDVYSIQENRIQISGSSAGTGLLANRSNGVSSNTALIVNNFVQVAGGTGLSLSTSSNINVYYNSVHINPNKISSTAGNVVSTYNSSAIDFRNNSFANMANGYVYDRSGGFTSNYNNLYTTGNLLSRNNVQDLAGWRTASSQDANSVSADPIYLSATDLHANQTLLDSAATVLGSFTTDIDGQTRDISYPDMGADEFDLIKNVGIVEVILPEHFRARKWTTTAFSKTQEIEIVVRNFGPDVKDIPLEYQFNGTTVHDTIKKTITAGKLDTFKFATKANMDTVGTHLLSVFTAMPNDQFIENDTMNIDIVTLENAKAKLPFVEDFENIKDTAIFENYLGMWGIEEWDFATDGGRLQTLSGKKVSGLQAISLDRTPNGPIKKNELILNLNMSRYDNMDSVYLDFDYIDHRDERHSGDSVWVRGSDTSAWIGIYDLWKNRRTNRVKEVRNIEITSAFAAAGQLFTESFQVKFGQEDNQRLPGDGRTFDNIVVRAVLPYDLTITDAVVEYRQVPKDMADNRFHATIGNQGYSTADSVYLKVNVAGAINQTRVDSLMRDQDTSLTLTDSMNTQITGVYTAFLSADFNGIDKCWENDSMDINFSLTDTVLARDDNVVDSTFGFTGSSGQMGTVLEVLRRDTLTSVSFYLNFPKIGDTLKADVYEIVNDTIGNKIISTTSQVVSSNASAWYNLPVKCMEVLKSGKYLVSVNQSTTSYLTLGITRNNYMPNASWINQGSGWTAFEDSLQGYLFSIHANFGKYDLAVIGAPKALCLNDNPIVLTSNKKGGKFSGTGVVNDSLFDPKLTGYGNFKIKYGLLKPNGCQDTSGVNILVDSLPVVTFTNPNAVCNNEGLISLSGGLPNGGTYLGNGVTANRLNTNSLTSGMNTLKYRYAKPISGCADTATAQIRIKAVPNVSFASVQDFCIDDSVYTFTQGNPAGGKYNGNGVVADSTFNAVTAGLGSHKVTYTFVDTNSCSDTASYLVMVNDTPSNNLGADTALCRTASLGLSATSIGTYLWSTGAVTEHLTVTQKGQYWLLITNQYGCTNRDTINVSFDAVCVGIDKSLVSHSSINYYPNPNSGTFNLNLNSDFNGEVKLIVRNMQGQIVSSESWLKTETDMIREINLNNQASGVYFLDLITPLGKAQHRITINK